LLKEYKHRKAVDIFPARRKLLSVLPIKNTVKNREISLFRESAMRIRNIFVKFEGRFIIISTEKLFGDLCAERLPQMKSWLENIYLRYAWICENEIGNT